MNKETIQTLVGDTTGLFSSTSTLLERVSKILEGDQFSDEEGKIVIDALYEVLGENGDKMQRYLINALSVKLSLASFDETKIALINETLMEEAGC